MIDTPESVQDIGLIVKGLDNLLYWRKLELLKTIVSIVYDILIGRVSFVSHL